MSYTTINKCVHDPSFVARVDSCIAQEQRTREEKTFPDNISYSMRWAVATATDVEAAYASALAAENPDPGGDESVITDGMILSVVQNSWDVIVEPPPT